MSRESLDQALANGGTAIGGWVAGGGQYTLALYARAGYDYLGIDCQHSVLDEVMVAALVLGTSLLDPATVVRVSKNDPTLIGRLADAGVEGVIIPMVNTPEEAAAAVSAVRFPPHGVRSFGPLRPDLPAGDLVALGERVRIFVQIETTEGFENVEAICAVPGLAGVYVGPADLCIGLGLDPMTATSGEQLVEPLARIRAACEASGLILGMHQLDLSATPRWIERGVRLASLGSDNGTFLAAVTADLKMLKNGEPSSDSSTGSPYA